MNAVYYTRLQQIRANLSRSIEERKESDNVLMSQRSMQAGSIDLF